MVVDTIVGVVVCGALEIVIALVTFDMTHEDSENPFGDDQKTLGEAQTFLLAKKRH